MRPWVIALALLLSALVSVVAFYADLLYFVSGRFTAAAPATAPLVLVFLLAAVGLIAPLGRLLRLTRAEVLATYAIMTAGAPLVSHGILGYLLPHVIYPQFATATLVGYYHYGFLGVRAAGGEGWLASQVTWGAESIPAYLSDPSALDPRGLVGIAAGGLLAVGLSLLRARSWWWPLHPVGFLAAQSWGMHWYYGPFFIGWAAKALVTRYGGLRVYRRTVPLAVGLVAGDLLGKVVWSLYQVAVTFLGRP